MADRTRRWWPNIGDEEPNGFGGIVTAVRNDGAFQMNSDKWWFGEWFWPEECPDMPGFALTAVEGK